MDAIKKPKQRTVQQNSALHLYFRQAAQALNDAGYEQKITIGTVDTPWTEERVKIVTKKMAQWMFGKHRTSNLTTQEMNKLVPVVERWLANQGI